MLTVIAFDVSCNRLRYRLVKVLKEYGQRVQKSVFEGPELNQSAYLRMRSRCERTIDPETDRLRYYRLCAACAARIEHYGVGVGLTATPEDFEVVG
jgi:CRISPR-associated protein Cas2